MRMKNIVIHGAKQLQIEEQQPEKLQKGQVAINLAMGGICGSDLHYYNHGGFGAIKLREPMILGHEVAGYIHEMADDVTAFKVGDLVAISPSRPCYNCEFCEKQQFNHCLNMRFYGSAMPFPHIQGAFRQKLIANQYQCVVANGLTSSEAAMAEPLAVCLHAARLAGALKGKTILITGSGPIGALCTLVARAQGAKQIVVTDISDAPLVYAMTAGADRVINIAKDSHALDQYAHNKGYFDCLFECSGAQSALQSAIEILKPGATLMQLGLGGDMTLPLQAITAKELQLKGSFRFREEFEDAVQLMLTDTIDVKPLISHILPINQAQDAFDIASDRQTSMKVHIDFGGAPIIV